MSSGITVKDIEAVQATIDNLKSTPEGRQLYENLEAEAEMNQHNGDSWDFSSDYVMPDVHMESGW